MDSKIPDPIEHKATFDDDGNVVLKKKINISRGRKSRASGARFELKVRSHLETDGWILDKWTNNFDLETNQTVKAKRKFNPFKKVMTIGTGFPDFIALRRTEDGKYEVVGIEVKSNGWLDKTEKAKCRGLLDNNVFSKILIARKGKKRGTIDYKEFE